jgi:hypothetical protein
LRSFADGLLVRENWYIYFVKRVVFAAAMVILALKLDAQTSSPRLDSPIYLVVDSLPKFPGGLKAFRHYIDENVNRILKNSHPTGIIITEILIEKDGKIKSTPGIVDGLPGKTDSVVVYLLKNTPTWKPGIRNGKPVRTLLQIPIEIHNALDVDREQSRDDENAAELEDELTINIPQGIAEESKLPDPQEIYSSVENPPEFPGGKPGFDKYIKDNVKIKESSKAESVKVVLSFIVERDGSLTNIKVEYGLSENCNNEALRLLQHSPKWRPGVENGWTVRTRFPVTIYFNPVMKDYLILHDNK